MSRLAGAARANVSGEDPFLFYRQHHDWRWLSLAGAEARLTHPTAAVEWASDPLQATLAALARPFDPPAVALLLDRLPPSARRDILVLDRPPAEADGAMLLGWAGATGAALVLEPQSERVAWTVAWARPTIVAGTRAELATLGATLLTLGTAARLRRRRGPLGRVRALLALDTSGELPEPWRSLGVAVTEPR